MAANAHAGCPLLLSLFRGIGLLDKAFELEWPGATIVCGPDVLWGSDIRGFHVQAGVFSGVFGGPPCQMFSSLAHMIRADGRKPHFGNLIPEFERVVGEARPLWFLMENVPAAPVPVVDGYIVHAQILNNRWFGAEQQRVRRFCFGTHMGMRLIPDVELFEAPLDVIRTQALLSGSRAVPVRIGGTGKVKVTAPPAVTAAHQGSRNRGKIARYTIADACELQGLPRDFLDDAPWTQQAKMKAVANGVPLPLGRAVAQAVKRAVEG